MDCQFRFDTPFDTSSLSCIYVQNIGGESGSPLRVLVDYASPNMAKELHVGHVRSAIIGHAISNTLELLGHDVQRVSHVGDFGTPIALVVARALSLVRQ
jgi:arginyl-tRNA synthetase